MTACGSSPQLSRGLSLRAVRILLPHWQAEPLAARFSDDRSSYITIWDFIPPPDLDTPPLRLTFINDKLETWGPPSPGGAPTLFT